MKEKKNIMYQRFEFEEHKDYTQKEVAEEVRISQAQASRLEKGVLDKIKKQLD